MSTQVVQSYANAFYEMANEVGKATHFVEEIEALAPVFNDSEIVKFFKSPIFSAQEKETAVENALSGKADADLIDFLKLLARNGRIGFLSQIVDEFKQSCSGGKGAKRGEVVSAASLSDGERKSLQEDDW